MTHPDGIESVLRQMRGKKPEEGLTLRDLTREVREGKLAPVMGRKSEIEEVIEILNQHRKANPIVLGPAGSGKTALVEGVAQVLHHVGDQLPQRLRNVRLLSLDPGELIAGTHLVGALEARISKIFRDLKDKKAILFIDEIHTLYGAGAGGKSNADASNLLKPHLARSGLRVIGATTDEEYHQIIRGNPAFERRFMPVWIRPLEKDAAKKVLKTYLAYRKFELVDETLLDSLILLAQTVLSHRSLPDSVLDILERALSLAEIAGRKQLDQIFVDAAMRRLTRVPGNLQERLAQLVAKNPYFKDIGSQLLELVSGKRKDALILEFDDPDIAEKTARSLADVLGSRIDMDMLAYTNNSARETNIKNLSRLLEQPFSVLFLKNIDAVGHRNMVDEIRSNNGLMLDGQTQPVPVRIAITAPARHRKIGFV